MNTLPVFTSHVKTITLDAETFATIDPAYGLVTLHRGQQTGADSDWGGQVIGSLSLDAAIKIAQAVQATDIQAEDDYIEWLAAREEERRDAMADLLSSGWGHD